MCVSPLPPNDRISSECRAIVLGDEKLMLRWPDRRNRSKSVKTELTGILTGCRDVKLIGFDAVDDILSWRHLSNVLKA